MKYIMFYKLSFIITNFYFIFKRDVSFKKNNNEIIEIKFLIEIFERTSC